MSSSYKERKKKHIDEDEAPKENQKEVDERDVEPTIEPLIAKDNETNHSDLLNSSHETLDGSPRIQQKEIPSLPVQQIFDVAPMVPEVLGLATMNDVFEKAVKVLDGFIQDAKHFRAALLDFERRYCKDKRPDFQKCFQVYLRNKEAAEKQELQALGGSFSSLTQEGMTSESLDKLLAVIQTSGEKLLITIEETRPKVQDLVEEAEKYDSKEHVKEKMEEQGQTGLLSKFSAPGKYRRNMKQLRKQRKALDDIPVEVRSILSVIEQEHSNKSDQTIAVENTNHKDEEISKSNEEECSETEVVIESTPEIINADDYPVPDIHATADLEAHNHIEIKESREIEEIEEEDEQAKLTDEIPDVERPTPVFVDELEITETVENVAEHSMGTIDEVDNEELPPEKVIDSSKHNESQISEHEKADVILPLRPSSPSVSLMKAKLSDSWDRLDDGKLVDYGSYLVLDPSANDEVQIMRRSRSLDSLSSLGSRRSLFRFGSYEFVTDYEIKIADKAEAEKARKMLEAPPQLKTNAPTHPLPQTKTSQHRHGGTSPIYKYTELEYNALGH